MEVAKENGRLGASNDENNEYQEEESKHIVGLIGPNTVQ